MQIKNYIQGNKHGKEANRLEREAMNDPFLQEALEGFDAVPGNHAEIIERLEKNIITPTVVEKNNRRVLYFYSIAASVLLLIGVGIYFIWDTNNQKPATMIAQVVEDDITITVSELEPPPPPPPSANAEQMVSAAPAAGVETQMSRGRQQAIQPEAAIQESKNAPQIVMEDMILSVDADETRAQELVEADVPPVSAGNEMKEDRAFAAESEYAAAKRSYPLASNSKTATDDSKSTQTTFGKKEFQAYCQKNAKKNTCDGKKVSVRASFYIDAAGKPVNIKCDRYTCENAKKEIERLLSESPAWTTPNQQITMTVTL